MLYFTHGDVTKARSLLQSAADEGGRGGQQQLKHNMQSLNAVAGYAENLSECRRVLLMRHFGEVFDPFKCTGVDMSYPLNEASF